MQTARTAGLTCQGNNCGACGSTLSCSGGTSPLCWVPPSAPLRSDLGGRGIGTEELRRATSGFRGLPVAHASGKAAAMSGARLLATGGLAGLTCFGGLPDSTIVSIIVRGRGPCGLTMTLEALRRTARSSIRCLRSLAIFDARDPSFRAGGC